jgi:hypothetical protein
VHNWCPTDRETVQMNNASSLPLCQAELFD